MNRSLLRGCLAASSLLLVAKAYTWSEGPLPGHTGAPGEPTCNTSGCHTGNPINAPGGAITLDGVPDRYFPGAHYALTVHVARGGQSRWGFQVTAKRADRTRGGDFAVTERATTQRIAADGATRTSPWYVEHSTGGTAKGAKDRSPGWISPAAGSGAVTLYAAGNAANGNGQPTGDYIYTTSAVSVEGDDSAVYGDLNGDGIVDLRDAVLAMQIADGLLMPTGLQIAIGDVAPAPGVGPRAGAKFGDGKIDRTDAMRILRRALHLDDGPFP